MARIQVAGQISGTVKVLRVLAALAVLISIPLMLVDIAWIAMTAIGLAFCVPLEIYAAVKRAQRAWIEDLGDGVELTGRGGPRSFRDADVIGVALEQKIDNTSMQETRSVTKSTFWLEGDPRPIVIRGMSSASVGDPTAEIVNRLIGGFIERTHEGLTRGGALAGERWRLSRTMLACEARGQEERYDLSALAAVDVFSGQVCLWRKGEEQPALRIPVSSRNACILPALLERLMPERKEDGQVDIGAGLGRILFERQQKALPGVVAAVVFAVIGVAILIPLPIVGALLLLGGLLCGVWALFAAKSSFRCHERGVYSSNVFGEKSLRYEDVECFTYEATRHYVNGAYTGTVIQLVFVPTPGVPGGRIRYSTNVKGADDDLDALRDHIARVIAQRMLQELSSSERVEWTNRLTFLKDGIEYVPQGMLGGRKDARLLPYAEYGGFSTDQGQFFLFAKDTQKPVYQEPVSAPNFYPGFFVLLAILHRTE